MRERASTTPLGKALQRHRVARCRTRLPDATGGYERRGLEPAASARGRRWRGLLSARCAAERRTGEGGRLKSPPTPAAGTTSAGWCRRCSPSHAITWIAASPATWLQAGLRGNECPLVVMIGAL